MEDTALVVVAVGIRSRSGGNIKQLGPVGPGGEVIMGYSIHDVMEAVSHACLRAHETPFR